MHVKQNETSLKATVSIKPNNLLLSLTAFADFFFFFLTEKRDSP